MSRRPSPTRRNFSKLPSCCATALGYRLYTACLKRWLLAVLVTGLLAGFAAAGCRHDSGNEPKILFSSDRDGDFALYAMNADGSGQTRVMQGAPSSPYAPTTLVSPNRRRLLLLDEGLWAVDLDGGRRFRLARGEVFSAAWSPDGKSAAYATEHGLFVVRADGHVRRRLTRRGSDGSPAWSPDGRHIAYAAEDGLHVIGADGRGRRHLARLTLGFANGPTWSPDGDRIAFVGGDFVALSEHLYVIEVGGAPKRLVRHALGTPAWSPDGDELAYVEVPPDAVETRAAIAVVAARGGRPRRLTSGVAGGPMWSPDGERILFASRPTFELGANEVPQVWTVQRDGTDRRRLTGASPNGGANHPVGWIEGDHSTERPPRASVEQLPRGGRVLHVPHPVGVLSAEGDRVAIAPPPLEFESNASTPPFLIWSPQDGGVERRLISGCRSAGWPTLSGRRVVYDCNNSQVDTIDHSVRVFSPERQPREVFAGRNDRNRLHSGVLLEGIVGGHGLIVFGSERMRDSRIVSRRVWRVSGDRPVPIRSGLGAGVPIAAEAGRIAVQVDERRVAVLRLDGTVRRTIRLSRPLPRVPGFVHGADDVGAAFSGPRLLVLTKGRLSAYDTRTGRLEQSARLPRGSRSLAVAGGLAAYVRGRKVRIRRLSDGRELVFRVGGALVQGALRGLYVDRRVHADLTAAGLVYSYNLRAARTPGRVVFVPRSELVRRLAGATAD